MDAPRTLDTLRVGGLSLAQYAAVRAALAEEHPLDAVLAIEGIDARTWRSAERAWQRRLVHDNAARARYETEIAAAEDWLDRRVAPLDSDERAWAAFLQEYTLHHAPAEMLAGLRLRVGDLGRLGRKWKARAAADPTLEPRIAEMRRSPGKLPPLEVAPAVLRASRGVASRGAEVPGSAAALLSGALPAVAVRGQESAAALAQGWRSTSHRTGQLPTYLAPEAVPSPDSARPSFAAGLPAAAGPPSAPVASAPVASGAFPSMPVASVPVPASMRGFANVDGTQLGAAAPAEKAALPFNPSAEPHLPPRAEAPAWMPKGMQGMGDVGGTQIAPPSARGGPALPFDGAAARGVPAPAAPAAAQPRAQAPSNAGGAAAPTFSMEQYASLVVELDLDPARRLDTLGRYGITEAQRALVDARFQAWFAAEPAARSAWERACSTYRAWLLGGGKR